MITNALIDLGVRFSRLIIGLFPTATLDTSPIANAMNVAIPIYNEWNNIYPLDTMFIIFGLVIGIEVGMLVFRILTWIRPPFVPLHPNF
jgi:hypothetical protein